MWSKVYVHTLPVSLCTHWLTRKVFYMTQDEDETVVREILILSPVTPVIRVSFVHLTCSLCTLSSSSSSSHQSLCQCIVMRCYNFLLHLPHPLKCIDNHLRPPNEPHSHSYCKFIREIGGDCLLPSPGPLCYVNYGDSEWKKFDKLTMSLTLIESSENKYVMPAKIFANFASSINAVSPRHKLWIQNSIYTTGHGVLIDWWNFSSSLRRRRPASLGVCVAFCVLWHSVTRSFNDLGTRRGRKKVYKDNLILLTQLMNTLRSVSVSVSGWLAFSLESLYHSINVMNNIFLLPSPSGYIDWLFALWNWFYLIDRSIQTIPLILDEYPANKIKENPQIALLSLVWFTCSRCSKKKKKKKVSALSPSLEWQLNQVSLTVNYFGLATCVDIYLAVKLFPLLQQSISTHVK